MIIFRLTGLTISKLLIKGILWISAAIYFQTYLKNHRKFKRTIPSFAFYTLLLIFIFNIISNARSVFIDDGPIISLYDKPASLALLVPFIIIF